MEQSAGSVAVADFGDDTVVVVAAAVAVAADVPRTDYGCENLACQNLVVVVAAAAAAAAPFP